MNALSPQFIGLLWGTSELCLNLAKRAKGDAKIKDRRSLALIWSAYLVGIVLGIVAAYKCPWGRFPGSVLVTTLVVGLFAFGIALRWYSIFYLGRYFTVNVAIQPGHRVIDSGPYRFIRHPSYTGSLISVIGFALSFHNWASFIIIVVSAVSAMLWRIQVEETALREALHPQYGDYMLRTRRLVPFVY
ncbi:MAG: Protein-S-isoprenylcysteine O-methyltransferase Ste14 [Verrucomicrobiales bacterium]|nr:Protein-S-isoprenylcysteine O-methyltransferase Ste14 [Verrucomicrobiales bacterium]